MNALSSFKGPVVVAAAAFAGLLAAPAARAFDVQPVVSPGGIEAWLVEAPDIPVVNLQFAFQGSSGLDPEGKEGVAALVSLTLSEGAGDMDAAAFQAAAADNNITLSFVTDVHDFSGSLYALSEDRDLAFSLLEQALTAPRFDAAALERKRAALFATIQQQLADPSATAGLLWQATAFPDHPYGRPVSGTIESVSAITAADLRAFVASRFARDNLKIGVVGDITAAELGPLLDATFGALPEHATPWELQQVEMQGQGELLLVEVPLPQTIFFFGQPGPRESSEEYYAVSVVNHIIGGSGFLSRLMVEVRERRGLTYGIGSSVQALTYAGTILGGTSTVNERAAETLQVLSQQWQLMGDEGPTEDEVEEAKLFINGVYALGFNDTRSIAGSLVNWQLLGLPRDYADIHDDKFNAVTPEIAAETARRWWDMDDMLVVVVGQPSGITPTRVAGDEIKAMFQVPPAE